MSAVAIASSAASSTSVTTSNRDDFARTCPALSLPNRGMSSARAFRYQIAFDFGEELKEECRCFFCRIIR